MYIKHRARRPRVGGGLEKRTCKGSTALGAWPSSRRKRKIGDVLRADLGWRIWTAGWTRGQRAVRKLDANECDLCGAALRPEIAAEYGRSNVLRELQGYVRRKRRCVLSGLLHPTRRPTDIYRRRDGDAPPCFDAWMGGCSPYHRRLETARLRLSFLHDGIRERRWWLVTNGVRLNCLGTAVILLQQSGALRRNGCSSRKPAAVCCLEEVHCTPWLYSPVVLAASTAPRCPLEGWTLARVGPDIRPRSAIGD